MRSDFPAVLLLAISDPGSLDQRSTDWATEAVASQVGGSNPGEVIRVY